MSPESPRPLPFRVHLTADTLEVGSLPNCDWHFQTVTDGDVYVLSNGETTYTLLYGAQGERHAVMVVKHSFDAAAEYSMRMVNRATVDGAEGLDHPPGHPERRDTVGEWFSKVISADLEKVLTTKEEAIEGFLREIAVAVDTPSLGDAELRDALRKRVADFL